MNVSEIVNRSESETIQEREMIFVVESYIEVKKNVRVSIKFMSRFTAYNDVLLLMRAYEYARAYYLGEEFKESRESS